MIAGRMQHSRLCGISLAAVLLASLVPGAALFAQTPSLAQHLPPNAVCYVEWRGMAFLSGAEKKNHVLQLLEDPDLAPVWVALASSVERRNRGQSSSASAIAPLDLLSLLVNPVAFGLVENDKTSRSSPPGGMTRPGGFFLVYDATGKTDLIEKWIAPRNAHILAGAEVTHYDFDGTSVEVRPGRKNVFYIARAANYYLMSDQKQTIEDLVTNFHGAGHSARSLDQLPEYHEAQKFLGPESAIEFFARMPDLSRWSPPDAKGNVGAELERNLHLERIHVAEGAVSFAGEATHFRGAVLGDTSPGGSFDLAAPSSSGFEMQQIASAGSEFTFSRLNLTATYAFMRAALAASLPPQKTANLTVFEDLAQGFLGMPVTEALGLFTGEVASVSSYSVDGRPQRMFAATIQRPEAVLRVLRAVIGPMIASEDYSGSTTYLDISYPYRDSNTGMRRRRFYYVAVTPQMILAAPQKAMLRHAVTQLGSHTGPAQASGIFANTDYVQMRSYLPEKLSGLSGADITQIPWDKLLANLEDRAAKRPQDSHPTDVSWLKLLKPQVILRHLHMTLTGWWKDPSGVYFDSYLQ
jgi:hypothetical protein